MPRWNFQCPCRSMSKNITCKEIEKIQENLDQSYLEQQDALEDLRKLIEREGYRDEINVALQKLIDKMESVEITNRKAIHDITGHADTNGYQF